MTLAYIALALAFLALLGGLFVGAMYAAQSPAFYKAIIETIVAAVLPKLAERHPSIIEDQIVACKRRGGTWDNIRLRCKL